ncbi:MAG: hypothetical protein WA114_04940 [Psychrobacter glacincola]
MKITRFIMGSRVCKLPAIVKISQKRYSAADINFLQPLSASYSKQEKLISAVLDVSILLFPDYS